MYGIVLIGVFMVTCMDVNNLKLDGMELVAGESGLKRMVSWTYLVQTKPYEEHMNRGNFALIVVDYIRFDFKEVRKSMDDVRYEYRDGKNILTIRKTLQGHENG